MFISIIIFWNYSASSFKTRKDNNLLLRKTVRERKQVFKITKALQLDNKKIFRCQFFTYGERIYISLIDKFIRIVFCIINNTNHSILNS